MNIMKERYLFRKHKFQIAKTAKKEFAKFLSH